MIIRQFRASDVEELIKIAEVSFAEEYTARGGTPESFAQQIRMAARGRMIPFKILTALAGYKWEMFVAEVDGQIVGCGGYLGRKQMELSNLMVAPQYRRRGIGQALLEKRLQRLTEKGFPFVTTTVLASNQASLGNLSKQSFEVFDRYIILETALPFEHAERPVEDTVSSRPIQPSDLDAFEELEEQISNPLWLKFQGSARTQYFLSTGERMINRLTGTQHWAKAFTKNGVIVGFLTASTSSHQTKGTLSRPIIADDNLHYLPGMLQEAADWLTQLGKTAMQMAVPEARSSLINKLQNSGWAKTQSWVRLVKRLDS